MPQLRVRPWGVRAIVCLVIGCFCSLVRIGSARAELEPFLLAETSTEPGVIVYPSRASGTRRITVLLHGMCSEPQNACSHFAERVTEQEHLVCPRARQRCQGGGSIWPHTRFASDIEAAVQRALSALAARVDANAPRTLIGYSLGAFRALDLAEAADGRYPRVMLIGAKIYPNARELTRNGVERLLLAAGDWDMMNAHMQQQTRLLARRGFAARFLGLGRAGHNFTPSFANYLPSALSWLHAEQAAP
ncbi:MAG: alpha/beta hydrolase [Myxococcota bacterium]